MDGERASCCCRRQFSTSLNASMYRPFTLVFILMASFESLVSIKYSPDLISDLREFIQLIPTYTVDEVVAEHMFLDSGFRKAIKFLRSSDFKQLQRQTEQIPEVIEIINFVHLNDTIKRRQHHRRYQRQAVRYNSVALSANPRDEVIVVVLLEPQVNDLNTFISFVQELLTYLPRQRFVDLINAKRLHSPIFAQFYAALRSSEFKQLVESAMTTQSVRNVIKTLADHAIDAQSLKNIGYEVISWGPA